jgi:hypothetical protein
MCQRFTSEKKPHSDRIADPPRERIIQRYQFNCLANNTTEGVIRGTFRLYQGFHIPGVSLSTRLILLTAIRAKRQNVVKTFRAQILPELFRLEFYQSGCPIECKHMQSRIRQSHRHCRGIFFGLQVPKVFVDFSAPVFKAKDSLRIPFDSIAGKKIVNMNRYFHFSPRPGAKGAGVQEKVVSAQSCR